MHGSISRFPTRFHDPQCPFHIHFHHGIHISKAPAQQILLLSQVPCGKEKRAALILVRVIWTHAFRRSGTTKNPGHVQGTAEGGKIPFSARLFLFFFLPMFSFHVYLFLLFALPLRFFSFHSPDTIVSCNRPTVTASAFTGL